MSADGPIAQAGSRRRSDAELLAAFVTLSATFALGGFLMPWWYIGVCLAAVGAVGAALTAPHWPAPLSELLKSHISLQRWAAAGAFLTVACLVVLSGVRSLTVANVAWTTVLCLSCARTAGALVPSLLEGVSRYPVWLLAAAAVTVTPMALAVRQFRLSTVLFLVVLVALALYIWIVLPLALYQRRREKQPPLTEPIPRVSVLIPAYNESGHIGDCVRSILASSYPTERLEVVVIDDGSGDSTAADARAYEDQGVTVISRENGGKHAAINLGLLCSTGEYVVAVDADSRVAPDSISTLVAQLQAEPDLGGIGGTVRVADNTLLARIQSLEYAVGIHSMRRAYSLFGSVPVLPGCLTIFRREALEDVSGFDPDTATEDFDVTIQLLKHGWKTRHSSAVVETNVPTTWSALRRQRLRWHRGGAETMWKHKDAFTDPQYGYLHSVVFPVQFVSRLLIPPVSYAILFLVGRELLRNPSGGLLTLMAFFTVLTAMISGITLLMDELDWRLLLYAPLLLIGYKDFVQYTVAAGLVQSVTDRSYDW